MADLVAINDESLVAKDNDISSLNEKHASEISSLEAKH